MIMPDGRILKGIGGFYYVNIRECIKNDIENNIEDEIIECKARGKFRNQKIVPLVGDYVKVLLSKDDPSKGSIEEIYPRKTELIRPAVANVEQAVIVVPAYSPEPNLTLVDTFLVSAEFRELSVLLCINKIDLDVEKKYLDILEIYRNVGYPVVCTSCVTGQGTDELRRALQGKVSVFAGVSGAGKSSVLNAVNSSFSLKTGELSAKIARGKHTTRHLELLELDNGSYVVDTPGFSSMDLDCIKEGDLQYLFLEFKDYILQCKYTGCSHTSEQGCKVIEAVRDGAISPLRYQSYLNFYDKLKNVKKW